MLYLGISPDISLAEDDMITSFHFSLLVRKLTNKLTSAFHASVCPVIDHEFRHNIVRVADYFGNVITKFIVNNRIDRRMKN